MTAIVKAKIKGTVYCYRSESYWDKEEKKAKSRRILIGKIDPETGEMVPTQPRGGRQGKHVDQFSEAEALKAADRNTDENDSYKEKYEKLKKQLVSTEKELIQVKMERDDVVEKYSRLSKAVREAASLT